MTYSSASILTRTGTALTEALLFLTLPAAAQTGYFQPRELAVLAPDSLDGVYPAGSADFGDTLTVEGVTGTLVHVQDPGDATIGAEPGEGCVPLTNPDEIEGNVAFVRRGACEFETKVFYAQHAGATAAVVYNDERVPDTDTTVIHMGCPFCEVVIPSVFVSRATGLLLLGALDAGAEVVVRLQPAAATAAEPPAEGPAPLTLSAPQPNPTLDLTMLTLTLGRATEVTVEVFDPLGRRIALLHEGWLGSGRHPIAFDGAGLPVGLYVVRTRDTGGNVVTQRLILAR